MVSTGLVDLQVNGYKGLDCNDPAATSAMIPLLAKELLAVGVTTFAPTVITASEPDILSRLGMIAEGRASDAVAEACIPFIHVEGPHISPFEGFRGAHRESCVRPPSLAEFARWQDACGGLVGLITLSPHWDAAGEYIAGVVAAGVHVSIGHSHASEEQIHRAVDAGARLSTHLGNGIATAAATPSEPDVEPACGRSFDGMLHRGRAPPACRNAEGDGAGKGSGSQHSRLGHRRARRYAARSLRYARGRTRGTQR